MGTDDKVENKVQGATGTVKERVGDATGDRDLEAEGKKDRAMADLKDAGEKVKDAFKR